MKLVLATARDNPMLEIPAGATVDRLRDQWIDVGRRNDAANLPLRDHFVLAGFGLIRLPRSREMQGTDLYYIRWGFIFLFFMAMPVAGFVWHVRG